MYSIELVGPGQAYFDDKAVAGCPAQQHSLLFYYFLLNRQIPRTRVQIAALFWGAHSFQTARKNLRNALWRLVRACQASAVTLDDTCVCALALRLCRQTYPVPANWVALGAWRHVCDTPDDYTQSDLNSIIPEHRIRLKFYQC